MGFVSKLGEIRVLCQSGLLELDAEAAALDSLWIAPQHLKLRLPGGAPESDVELVFADTKVKHSQIGQPLRQQRIDMQPPLRRIGP